VDKVTPVVYIVSVYGGIAMPTEITYTQARANLAALCDEVASTREPIVIHRQGAEDVALVAASELRSLIETAHLLRSPNNAQRLLTALVRAQRHDPSEETVDALRWEFDLGQTP
jgi:antitoxin YefM